MYLVHFCGVLSEDEMAKSGPRRAKLRPLGSHQKCWLWGRHAVLETLRAGRWPVMELHLAGTLSETELAEARRLADRTGCPVKVQSPARLEQLGHARDHQGYLAKMAEYPYVPWETLLAAPPPAPLYLVLDRVQDPHNLGAIVRSAEVFGADAVFLGRRGGVGVTTAAARASAGAIGRVAIARVDSLADLEDRLGVQGVAVAVADEKTGTDAAEADLAGPVAIVIGSEARGVGPEIARRATLRVRIPQHGAIGSLNAAAAAAVVLYEARRQRRAAEGA
jgi:23S rRNA (guanosine2251-2'-O)-methyltransferase